MKKRYLIMTAAVFASALLQAFTMNAFLEPVGLLPSGFTGIASLLSKILGSAGIHFSTSLGMVLLNIPVAIFCYQHIGKKICAFFHAAGIIIQYFFADH